VNRVSGYPGDVKKLLFRRQFLIGPTTYQPNNYWRSFQLNHDLWLSMHEDLDFCRKTEGENTVILIGISIDCTDSSKSQEQILDTLFTSFTNIQSIIEASKPLAGRWVIICQDSKDTILFTDPGGLRTVYYYTEGTRIWCASQPALIDQVKKLSVSADESLLTFINNPEFHKKESAWIGNKTIYENCFHLMPNHYLSCQEAKQTRFFPTIQLSKINDLDQAATEVSTYFSNIINGAFRQYDIIITLTAGYDSRLLLAASTNIAEKTSFYVEDMGYLKSYHNDIWVSKKLAKKFDLDYNIIGIEEPVPNWFTDLLAQNVMHARKSPIPPKIISIYSKLVRNENRIVINGNVTEIVRIDEGKKSFNQKVTDTMGNSTIEAIVNFSGYSNPFVVDEIKEWSESIDISYLEEANIFDMFHWEQKVGNWGALYPSEQDIAIDRISPFNCRLILETCLKVPRDSRSAPGYPFFKLIIEKLWPEILTIPINPGPRRLGLLKKRLRKNLPQPVTDLIRKFI
jgi:hypothetical protein